jgi:mono/diheme cytochrome c family protein
MTKAGETSPMIRLQLLGLALCMTAAMPVQAQPPGARPASPAADAIPATRVAQSYPAELVAAGTTLFSAQCGFCHGRDTRGGAGGADHAR